MSNITPTILHTQPIPAGERPEPMTGEIWRPLPPVPNPIADRNRIFTPVPATATPSDLFAVHANRCSPRGYRFIRKNDRIRPRGQALFFIDGACLDNGAGPEGPREPRAGAAVVFAPKAWFHPISHPLPLDGVKHTSNRAELRAALISLGLRAWTGEGFDSIVLATDSEYLVLGISERIHKWRENGWKTSTGSPVKNRDLWEALFEKLRELERDGCHVQFWLIPRAWNEADKYAKEAAAKPDDQRSTGADAIVQPVYIMERM